MVLRSQGLKSSLGTGCAQSAASITLLGIQTASSVVRLKCKFLHFLIPCHVHTLSEFTSHTVYSVCPLLSYLLRLLHTFV